MAEKKKPMGQHPWMAHVLVVFGVVAVLALVGIVALAFFYFHPVQTPHPQETNSSNDSGQGNGSFNWCASDSQCPSGTYCCAWGGCLPLVCGDGVCSPTENQSSSCPKDCGCPAGQVVNRYLNQCQTPLGLSNETVRTIVRDYLSRENITGKIVDIKDAYYGEQAVKDVGVDCQPPGTKFPCLIILNIDNNGKIINMAHTT